MYKCFTVHQYHPFNIGDDKYDDNYYDIVALDDHVILDYKDENKDTSYRSYVNKNHPELVNNGTFLDYTDLMLAIYYEFILEDKSVNFDTWSTNVVYIDRNEHKYIGAVLDKFNFKFV